MRKLIVILVSLLFSLSNSAHDFELDGIYYNVISTNDLSVEVTYRGSTEKSFSNEYMGDIVIPEKVLYNSQTYYVKSIGDWTFFNCPNLTSLVIPNGVTMIEECAFYNCTSLDTVVIPNSVKKIGNSAFYNSLWYNKQSSGVVYAGKVLYKYKGAMPADTMIEILEETNSIGDYAFSDCSNLISILIPNSVTSIQRCAFLNCSGLSSINIPNNLSIIENSAFSGCSSLKSITIPKSVSEIGTAAFSGCFSLSTIIVDSENLYFDSRNNSNSIIESATNTLIVGCKNTIVPTSVTSIGKSAFAYCRCLTAISIPNNVITIGQNAFIHCSAITSITIPKSVTNIDHNAFYGCSVLNSVILENSKPIELSYNDTFSNRARATLYVPNGSYGAYYSAYGWKEFNKIVEYELIENIDFADAKVKEICVANWDTNGDGEFSKAEAATVTDIGTVFSGNKEITSFDEFQYFTKLNEICDSAFYCCHNLNSLTIPDGVTCIGNRAFLSCRSLDTLNIPNGVTSIYSSVFQSCSNLTSITIPNSITSIGNAAFKGCSKLTSVYISDISAWCNIKFGNNTSNPLSYAKCLFVGNTEITKLVIPDNVTSIGSYAFFGCSSITSVSIPEGVESIGSYAFYGCSSITSVSISEGVKSIGPSAFYGCSGLNSVSIPNSVVDISSSAFSGCSGLTSLVIPHGITSIGTSAFNGCSGLTALVIPNSVTNIGYVAFKGCSGLTSLVIPNSVASIGRSAFNNCSGLSSIKVDSGNAIYDSRNNCNAIIETLSKTLVAGCKNTAIPDDITSIGDYAFGGCSGLTSLIIPNGVTSIGDYAFSLCQDLTSIVIPGSVSNIGVGAFQCIGLASVTVVNCTPIVITSNVFPHRANATLYVPHGCKSAYEAADVWKEFKEIIEMEPTDVTITINQYGSSTYCSEYALDFTEVEGLKAYVAGGYNTGKNAVLMVRTSTTKPNTGLLVKGEPGDYTVPIIETSEDNYLNLLVGTTEKVAVNTNSSDGKYTNFKYTILTGDTAPKFYKFEDGSTLSANKAYLQIPTEWLPATSEAKTVRTLFEDEETTGINDVYLHKQQQDGRSVYDLTGRRVENPAKGLYIVNGRKVVIK